MKLASPIMAKIADFGLATTTAKLHVEKNEQIMGTPRYIPPEQIRSQPLDGRSDVFSLGITAFILFTGKLPFNDQLPAGYVIEKTGREVPRITEAAPHLPEQLADIVAKMVRREKTERYTAEQLVGVLEALQLELAANAAKERKWKQEWQEYWEKGNR